MSTVSLAAGNGRAVLTLRVASMVLTISAVGGAANADSIPADLAKQISARLDQVLETEGYPSLSVAIVRKDTVLYERAVGYANRRTGQRASAQTRYWIGSVTKPFTATLLVSLRDEGVVRLDDPVAMYLPDTVQMPTDQRGAPAITLRHLATHTSGLPMDPVNLRGSKNDPYADHTVADLFDGLATTEQVSPTGSQDHYSNLGFALLGHALARAAKKAYPDLLRERILRPLAMQETAIGSRLTEQKRSTLATGYLADDSQMEATEWHLESIEPAGGIVSTARDLARFVSLHLRAGEADVKPVSGSSLLEMQRPQVITSSWDGGRGLGWVVWRDEEFGNLVRHDGGMDGFTSSVGFYPGHKVGVVVLTNCGKSVGLLAREILRNVAKRFDPAVKEASTHPAAKRLARKLAEYFVADPQDSLASLFQPAFTKTFGLDTFKTVLSEIHAKRGRCQSFRVHAGKSPRDVNVEFIFQGDKIVRCQLGVSFEAQPTIARLYFPDY